MPEISVVVPIYKVEKYLKRCIDSILNQSYKDFQLILVDDGSPDNCGQICDEYAMIDERIHVIHRENGGLSAARNSGIDWVFNNSFTEWITFIDSDDWVKLNYLEELKRTAEEANVNIALGNSEHVSDVDVVDSWSKGEVEVLTPESLWVKDYHIAVVAWAKLYKTRLFSNIRYPEGKLHEDELTTYRLLFSQDFVAITSARLYIYYFSPHSIMRSQWTMRKLDGVESKIEQLIFFHSNGYKKAFKVSQKAFVFLLLDSIHKIKKFDNTRTNLRILYKMISSYLVRLHNNRIFNIPLFSYIYVQKEHFKLFISARCIQAKRNRGG